MRKKKKTFNHNQRADALQSCVFSKVKLKLVREKKKIKATAAKFKVNEHEVQTEDEVTVADASE